MNGKGIIKEIIKTQNINASKMARALNTSRQVLHTTLNTTTTKDVTVDKLVSMANYLDYDVMLVPKTVSQNTKGYIVSREAEA